MIKIRGRFITEKRVCVPDGCQFGSEKQNDRELVRNFTRNTCEPEQVSYTYYFTIRFYFMLWWRWLDRWDGFVPLVYPCVNHDDSHQAECNTIAGEVRTHRRINFIQDPKGDTFFGLLGGPAMREGLSTWRTCQTGNSCKRWESIPAARAVLCELSMPHGRYTRFLTCFDRQIRPGVSGRSVKRERGESGPIER